MRNYLLILSVFFISILQSFSSHIVGGEFSLVYGGRGYNYTLRLNMYMDGLNAYAGLLEADPVINASIFRKSDNQFMTTVEITRFSKAPINYASNGCSDPGIIQTILSQYSGNVNLSGYNDPQGYYVVWERCCRNYVTANVYQNPLASGGFYQGQTFYLEFPPVDVGGNKFIDSTPIFAQAPANYLCKNKLYKVFFGGYDIDGDILKYKLVTPLKGHSSIDENTPVSLPAPYDSIIWKSGYGYSRINQIPGSPALTIDPNTGFVSVNPSQSGLFAFAIACEEYRNGIKIGETRRDFEFLVVNNCPVSHQPYFPLLGVTPFSADTLYVINNKDTCYSFFFSDSTASFYGHSDIENITYSTNLPGSTVSLSNSTISLNPTRPSASSDICFSACNNIDIERDSSFYLIVNITDSECPNNTVSVTKIVKVIIPPTSAPPKIYTSLLPLDSTYVNPDSTLNFIVYAKDPNPNDLDTISVSGQDFLLEDWGMSFTRVYVGIDSIAYLFSWTPNCDILSQQNQFIVNFSVRDKSCIKSHVDQTSVIINLVDIETALDKIIPTNLITPNGDGLNDCFYIKNIPRDNCTYFFKKIEVYNGWGSRVFFSSNRNFKWCAEDISDGVYYYAIDLNKKYVKGWIQVAK